MAVGSTTHLSRSSNYFTGPGAPANRQNGDIGSPWTPTAHLDLGAPTLASATFIVNAQAVAGAGNVATLANTVLDVPRALTAKSSSASDTTQTVLITGADVYGQTMSELIALNGTSAVNGKKAFKTVTTVFVSAVMVGNVSVGNTSILGLPCCVAAGGLISSKFTNNTADTGTFVAAVTTSPATTTTGDVRGTYSPSGTLDGSAHVFLHVVPVVAATPDPDTAAYGVTQV